MSEVTRILHAVSAGRPNAADELLPLVYQQLRAIAQQRMGEERPGHTLQATALVHEAYLKLVGDDDIGWDSRAHFYVAAAEAMRRILVDEARKKGRIKRGGDRERVPLSVVDLAVEQNFSEILALDEALRRMESEDARMGRVVMLRFFAGLSIDDTADAMGLSPRSVDREWRRARAWLYQAMHPDDV